jgi:hypothetical protein
MTCPPTGHTSARGSAALSTGPKSKNLKKLRKLTPRAFSESIIFLWGNLILYMKHSKTFCQGSTMSNLNFTGPRLRGQNFSMMTPCAQRNAFVRLCSTASIPRMTIQFYVNPKMYRKTKVKTCNNITPIVLCVTERAKMEASSTVQTITPSCSGAYRSGALTTKGPAITNCLRTNPAILAVE